MFGVSTTRHVHQLHHHRPAQLLPEGYALRMHPQLRGLSHLPHQRRAGEQLYAQATKPVVAIPRPKRAIRTVQLLDQVQPVVAREVAPIVIGREVACV